jgi:hypothetical protein
MKKDGGMLIRSITTHLSPVAALIPNTLLCPAAALIPLVNSSSFSLTSGMSILLITTTFEKERGGEVWESGKLREGERRRSKRGGRRGKEREEGVGRKGDIAQWRVGTIG